jgi:hypothetical protein
MMILVRPHVITEWSSRRVTIFEADCVLTRLHQQGWTIFSVSGHGDDHVLIVAKREKLNDKR